MPRDGSTNVYTQPFPDVVADTTIESLVYNGFTHDVETDLNAVRPIVAGGTGANNAHDALIAFGGEEAYQLVSNYDSHPFASGSFHSMPSATGSPVDGHYFVGLAYRFSGLATSTIVLEARDMSTGTNPPPLYVRSLVTGGTWSAWHRDGTLVVTDGIGIAGEDADMFFGIKGTGATARFVVNSESDATGLDLLNVFKAGSASLNATNTNSTLYLNKGQTGYTSNITSTMAAKNRWSLVLGDVGGETGSNIGSNFSLDRYDDAGALLGAAFAIRRDNANAAFANALNVAGALTVAGVATFDNAATFNNTMNIAGFITTADGAGFASDIFVGTGAADAKITFGNVSSTNNITYTSLNCTFNAAGYYFPGGNVNMLNASFGYNTTAVTQYFCTGAHYMTVDSTSGFYFSTAVVTGSNVRINAAGSGTLFFGSGGTAYLQYYSPDNEYYLNGSPINIVTPTKGTHAATKAYADTHLATAMQRIEALETRLDAAVTAARNALQTAPDALTEAVVALLEGLQPVPLGALPPPAPLAVPPPVGVIPPDYLPPTPPAPTV